MDKEKRNIKHYLVFPNDFIFCKDETQNKILNSVFNFIPTYLYKETRFQNFISDIESIFNEKSDVKDNEKHSRD